MIKENGSDSPKPPKYTSEKPPKYVKPPKYTSGKPPPKYKPSPLPKYDSLRGTSGDISVSDEKKDNVRVKNADIELVGDVGASKLSNMIKMREVWGKKEFDKNTAGRIKWLEKQKKEFLKNRQNALVKGYFTSREWERLIKETDRIIKVYKHQMTLPDIKIKEKSLKGVKVPKKVLDKRDKLRKVFLVDRSKENEDDPSTIIRAGKSFKKWQTYEKNILQKYGK